MFLPDKSTEPQYFSDGKTRVCPNCGDLLARYITRKTNKEATRLLKGFICPECKYIMLPLKDINEAIDLFNGK